MKARMRTVYTVHYDNGATCEGDCLQWAIEAHIFQQVITERRVLWLGPTWPCPACSLRHH